MEEARLAALNLQYELNGIQIYDIQEFKTDLDGIKVIIRECNSPLKKFFEENDPLDFIGDKILSNIIKPTIGLGCDALEKMGKCKRYRILRNHRRAVNRILKRKGLIMGKNATAHITSGHENNGVKVKLFTHHKDLYFHYDVYGKNLRDALEYAITWANVTIHSDLFVLREEKEDK